MARVLAQIPPPCKHLVRHHGFYSNAAKAARAARRRWADLLRRVYEVDPLVCPRCASTMRVVGFITQPEVIKRILDHLRTSQPARPRPPPPREPQPSISL